MEQSSFDVLDAAFLSSPFESPLHEMMNRADLREIDEETFARTCGARIPSDEVAGMTFWVAEVTSGQLRKRTRPWR